MADGWAMLRIWLASIALVVLTIGCATPKKHWPKVDETKKQTVILVAGHFSERRSLAEEPCFGEAGDYDGLIVDCFSGTPSVAKLTTFEVLYGTLPSKSVPVYYHPAFPWRRGSQGLPLSGKPGLIVLRSDGHHYFLTYLIAEVAQLATGEWALPVARDEDVGILPCGALPLARPVIFMAPLPRRELAPFDLEDAETLREIKDNPRVRLRSKYEYTLHGIPLKDIRTFVQARQPTLDDYECK